MQVVEVHEMVAGELTGSRIHNSQRLPALLAQIPDPIDQVTGDGAYYTRASYEAVPPRGATQSSCRGVRPDRAPLRIRPAGVPRAIVSYSRLQPEDAQRGKG